MVCLALIFNNTDNGTLVLYVHVYEVFERCLLPESLKKSRLFYILKEVLDDISRERRS